MLINSWESHCYHLLAVYNSRRPYTVFALLMNSIMPLSLSIFAILIWISHLHSSSLYYVYSVMMLFEFLKTKYHKWDRLVRQSDLRRPRHTNILYDGLMKYLFWNIILQIRTNIAFYLFDMIFWGHFIIELEKLFWLQMENNVFESL